MFAISILHIDKPTAAPNEPKFRPFVIPDREILKFPLSNAGISGAYIRLRDWLRKGWKGFTFETTTEPASADELQSTHDWKKLMILGFPEDANAPFERFSISGSTITVDRFEDPIADYLKQFGYVPALGVPSVKLAIRWKRAGSEEIVNRRLLIDKRIRRTILKLN